MGFKVGRIYVLEFEGTGMEGAIVKVRSPSIDTLEGIKFDAEEDLRRTFVEHLAEWNLESEDGTPVPMTLEGLKANLEPTAVVLMIREWYKAARGVTAPLDPRTTPSIRSDDGEQPLTEESSEPLIPMETL